MTSNTVTASGLSKQDASYLARIDRCLGEIKNVHNSIVRRRKEGRRTGSRIDRNLNQIQAAIDRVEAAL